MTTPLLTPDYPGQPLLSDTFNRGVKSLMNHPLVDYGVAGGYGGTGQPPKVGDLFNLGLSIAPGIGDLQAVTDALKYFREGSPGMGLLSAASALPAIPNLAHIGLLGGLAFHGSPHVFDAFDLSKIGTGEGFQAYGHGIYLSENPNVAKSYFTRLAPGRGGEGRDIAAGLIKDAGLTEDQAIKELTKRMNTPASPDFPDFNQTMQSAIQSIKDKTYKGGFYHVNIPDEHIDKMLDWDKPLSEQNWYPQKETLKDIVNRVKESGNPPSARDELIVKLKTMEESGNPVGVGRNIYNNLIGSFGIKTPQEASQFLREAGIPGIKYLDQGSRGEGGGTRNLVIFDPSIAKIIKRE